MATEPRDSTRAVEQAQAFAFDPERLRAKYREERDKRLRPDGNEQYIEVKDTFARFLDDPYARPGGARRPLTDEVQVAVIGAGSAASWSPHACARPAFRTSGSSTPPPT
jgi:hypothetical protein